ncbi:MAG: cytochrome C [Paracoccaceae bacterium]
MKYLILAATALTLASPAFATGDAAKGESDFKKCKACHSIASADEAIVKGGKTGPNLYGVIGRAAASVEDFKYGASLMQAGEAGLVWDEENMVTYLADPTAFLKEETGDSSAKSKMTFKLKNGEDVAAYLASFSPDTGESSEESGDSEEENDS